ncbi:hypothetical protein D1AOALGA4SA_1114 [Olavius algarvensis Delta 1 endosymbiont]|nr:hypothetical protein D1AOALGA4SA_1114 [Olavius algarvensis Delta 1 endosymbiont]
MTRLRSASYAAARRGQRTEKKKSAFDELRRAKSECGNLACYLLLVNRYSKRPIT